MNLANWIWIYLNNYTMRHASFCIIFTASALYGMQEPIEMQQIGNAEKTYKLIVCNDSNTPLVCQLTNMDGTFDTHKISAHTQLDIPLGEQQSLACALKANTNPESKWDYQENIECNTTTPRIQLTASNIAGWPQFIVIEKVSLQKLTLFERIKKLFK